MKICKACGGIAEWNSYYGGITCTRCGFVEKPRRTKADSLRAMNDEELAEWCKQFSCPIGLAPGHEMCRLDATYDVPAPDKCKDCWLDYLRQEEEE